MEAQKLSPSDIQIAIEAGRKLAGVQTLEVNGTHVLVVPQGAQLQFRDEDRERPRRVDGTITATSVQSFLDYFNRFSDANSTIFADIEGKRFVGVIDYHEDLASPRHGRHKVTYTCPLTPEAKKWLEHDKNKKNQFEFAEFIEDGAPEIVAPSAAEMLEIALTMQAKTDVDFRSALRLENGQVQLTFNENISGSAGTTGQLKIPSKINLGIQLFQGGERYGLEANFRYRLNSGKLGLWYELIRPHLALQDAVNQVCEQIRAGMARGQLIEAKPQQ